MMRWLPLLIVLWPSLAAGQTRALPEFNVVAFGATPNDATDDTTAIQKAIDAAAAASPATVVIPRGTFLAGALTISATSADVVIEGDRGAVLQRNGTGILLKIQGDRCKVRWLEFDGVDYASANTALVQIAGISSPLNNAEDNVVEFCYLHDTFDPTFGANGTVGADGVQILQAVKRPSVRFCHGHEIGGNAFRFTGYDTRISHCVATEYHNRGFRGYDGTRLWMDNCYAETTQTVYNGGAPCLIDPGADGLEECYISDCFFWINRNLPSADVGTQALKLAHIQKSVVSDSTLKATWSASTTHRAVRLEDCLREVTFRNCRIRGNFFITETGHGGIASQTVGGSGGFAQFVCTGDRVLIDPDPDLGNEDDAQELYIRNTGVAAYNTTHVVTAISSVTDNGIGTSPRYQFTVTTSTPYTAGTINAATAFWRSTPDDVTIENCTFGDEDYEAASLAAEAASASGQRQVAIENLNSRTSKIRDCVFNMAGTSPAINWAVDNDAYFDRLELVNNEFRFNRTGTCIAISPENSTNSFISSGKIIAPSGSNRIVNSNSGATQIVRTTNSIESGTCGSGSTTTAINLGEAATGTEIFEDKVLTIAGESRRITVWNQGTTTATVSSAFSGAPSAGTAWGLFDVTYDDKPFLFSTDGHNRLRFISPTGLPPGETSTDTNGVITWANGNIVLGTPNNATKMLGWVYTTGGWLGYGGKPVQTILNTAASPITFDKSLHDMTYRVASPNTQINLPAVSSGNLAGLRVSVICIEGSTGGNTANNSDGTTGDVAVQIDPSGSEIIVLPGATNSDGKMLRLDGDTDRAGDAITLEAGSDRWYAIRPSGAWSKEP